MFWPQVRYPGALRVLVPIRKILNYYWGTLRVSGGYYQAGLYSPLRSLREFRVHPVHPVRATISKLRSGENHPRPDSSSKNTEPPDWLSPSSPGASALFTLSLTSCTSSCCTPPKSVRRAGGRSSRPRHGGADPPRCPHTWRGTRGCCCACPSS